MSRQGFQPGARETTCLDLLFRRWRAGRNLGGRHDFSYWLPHWLYGAPFRSCRRAQTMPAMDFRPQSSGTLLRQIIFSVLLAMPPLLVTLKDGPGPRRRGHRMVS